MGQISPSDSTIAYTNDTDCYNYYITVPAGQTIIVSFLALSAQNNHAWVTVRIYGFNLVTAKPLPTTAIVYEQECN